MEILLRDLKLERVDFFDEAKIHYIEGLLDDELIKKYLGYLKDGISISKNMGYLSSHYVVKQGEKFVGYLYLSPPFIKDKKTPSCINLQIIVRKAHSFRCGMDSTFFCNLICMVLLISYIYYNKVSWTKKTI